MIRYICFFSFFISGYTIDAQCFPDRHNTTWYDGWMSCEVSPNPNPARGQSHWIHYDFGHLYKLKSSQFWNANQPDSSQSGLKNVVIDYSIDGINWTEWGTYTIPQGTGLNTYEGADGPDFEEIAARYFLITAIDNYGGTCFGFSEVKINVDACPVAGTPCDDGRPDTINDTYNDYCNCVGTALVFNDCIDSNLIINDTPIEAGTHDATNTIESAGLVRQGDDVKFIAAFSIALENGFEVELGAEFLAKILACNETLASPDNDQSVAKNSDQTWLQIQKLEEPKDKVNIVDTKIQQNNDSDSQTLRIETRSIIENLEHTDLKMDDDSLSEIVIFEKATLGQNIPNSFRASTKIQYFIPLTSQSATLKLFNILGQVIRNIDIESFGKGEIEIQLGNSGDSFYYYNYSLEVDGQIIDTKKLTSIKGR